jgi:hypothetical protein
MKPTTALRPRLILVDDNIRNTGGHYFELASLLLNAAQQIGYQPVLAPHQQFDQVEAADPRWELIPTFQTRRLVDWSLGVDGNSTTRRDLNGNPIGGSPIQNTWHRLRDQVSRPTRRPATMLRQWSRDLAGLLQRLKPTAADVLLVNTGDDFAMLALASALRQVDCPPLRVDVIFHFALVDGEQADLNSRLQQIGQQVNGCLKIMQPNQIHLHATTEPLARQMRQAEFGRPVTTIPYPTRGCEIRQTATARPKVVLAGLPRREKGRGAMRQLLAAVEHKLLRPNRFQFSMHLPADRWQSMIPPTLQGAVEQAANAPAKNSSLEVMFAHLTTDQYHRWLDTADIGLFLYQPDRYVARCSGVLLEMMARGIPVIVPDRCWLSDQVRAAGGHRSIGLIYQDCAEIPDLLEQFARQRHEMSQRAQDHAQLIAARHDPHHTLRTMGIVDFFAARRVA